MSMFNKVTKTFQWGQHTVKMETGEIARQSSGAVVVGPAIVSPEATFAYHTDVVEDVDWHNKDANMVGSCGDDGLVCLWDARRDPNADPIHVVRNAHDGDVNGIVLPATVAPRQADGLWQHTCFEAFNNQVGNHLVDIKFIHEIFISRFSSFKFTKPKWNKYIEIDKLKHLLTHQIIVIFLLKQMLELLH